MLHNIREPQSLSRYITCIQSFQRYGPNQSFRCITYLHDNSVKVRGIKKDPVTYFKNPHGLNYSDLQESKYHDKIRERFHFDKFHIKLNANIILQCLTHKSFAHGKVPYNEKLNLLGSQFLKFRSSIYTLNQTKSFNSLGSKDSRNMIHRDTLSQVIKDLGLRPMVFWKKRDPVRGATYNGEATILSTVLNSLVGAILIINGETKATKFVDELLLNKNSKHSLINATKDKIIEEEDK
ncbi:hypothetical protein KAFR_0I01350 [Kazachstania africana CBS 2517]|uniref:RNase III domain-containing protein n=1 Tax=Kazachstania africana (strain ATCC 22294 / BCRC 22015 / CBS 2517 / CECT 1963 / NBRC 1671 / NRRL Y-8276) TaxID=1071382 RepID=H2AZW6_KAZAF|nr:hypothetical protein KAFR_0I01350 [Kazachstania africana CBS 2517]CCF59916.1 hypothetical protein KAFR_0I01350 [Kazachstania africana CBS 2517]